VAISPPLAESKDTAAVAAGDGVQFSGWFWTGLCESGLPPLPAVAVMVNSSISGVNQFFFHKKLLSVENLIIPCCYKLSQDSIYFQI